MCGLAGVMSTLVTKAEVDEFVELLIMASLRGWHSTGTFMVGRENWNKPYQTIITKQVGDPYEFIKHSSFKKNEVDIGIKKIIAGHARYATKGKHTYENAHPFQYGHIVGMHNGTIHHKFDFSDDYETDSEALIRNIAEKGLQKALNDLSYGAAFALVIFNTNDNTLSFIRNDQRPLVYARDEIHQTFYWASEKMALEYLSVRHNLQFKNINILKPCTLLEYNLNETDLFGKGVKVEHDYIKDVWKYTSYNVVDTGNWKGHNSTFKKNEGEKTSGGGSTVTTSSKAVVPITSKGKVDVPWKENNPLPAFLDRNKKKQDKKLANDNPKIEMYKGYNSEWIEKSTIERHLNKGCAWCSSPKTLSDPVRWISKTEFVCTEHNGDPFLEEYIDVIGSNQFDTTGRSPVILH